MVDALIPGDPSVPGATGEAFYEGALRRISRNMMIAVPVLTAGVWWKFGWKVAIGFAAGCVISTLNFRWLKKVVTALVNRASRTQVRQSSAGVAMRFVFRYLLLALGAYVMIHSWPESVNGMLAGLFLPVVAVMFEAVQEFAFSTLHER